jgi:hypothetical protein
MRYPCLPVALVPLLACLPAAAAFPDEAAAPAAPDDTALYVLALELALGGDTTAAAASMRELLERFPASGYAERAGVYLEAWGSRLDRSGVVPFSIANLLTATAVGVSIPLAFAVDNSLTLSLSGLAGVGLGLGGSYLLGRGVDLSWGQELWMEVAQTVSLADYVFAWLIVGDTLGPELQRFVLLGGALTATIARGIGTPRWAGTARCRRPGPPSSPSGTPRRSPTPSSPCGGSCTEPTPTS